MPRMFLKKKSISNCDLDLNAYDRFMFKNLSVSGKLVISLQYFVYFECGVFCRILICTAIIWVYRLSNRSAVCLAFDGADRVSAAVGRLGRPIPAAACHLYLLQPDERRFMVLLSADGGFWVDADDHRFLRNIYAPIISFWKPSAWKSSS